MSFIDPEQDNSYITFWSQYPDPPDKAETLNAPSWLDKFRKKQQLKPKLMMASLKMIPVRRKKKLMIMS